MQEECVTVLPSLTMTYVSEHYEEEEKEEEEEALFPQKL
jgi:hypothetical protein